jgi:hypothetical protein
MNDTRQFAFLAVAAMMTVTLPCFGQDQTNGQATPDLSGTGSAGHVALWKNSTTLTNSVISQSSGSIGIGTTAPVAKLEVSGNAQVDGNFSLSGSILENGGLQLLWAPSNGSGNFSVGLGAMQSTTTGTQNTASGVDALASNTTGSGNSAIGDTALFSNMNGASNTAIGWAALSSNTSGSNNTAVGIIALSSNQSGTSNTAIGQNALQNTIGSDNTAVGALAGEGIGTGEYNTAIGSSALTATSNGSFSSALGSGALSHATGSNNIGIGYSGGNNITDGNNNIVLGNVGTASDNSTIRIGCSNATTCQPSGGAQTSTFIAGIYGSSTGLANVPVVIDPNGNLGTVQSSSRYKEDINGMGEASDGLMQLRPVTFR